MQDEPPRFVFKRMEFHFLGENLKITLNYSISWQLKLSMRINLLKN